MTGSTTLSPSEAAQQLALALSASDSAAAEATLALLAQQMTPSDAELRVTKLAHEVAAVRKGMAQSGAGRAATALMRRWKNDRSAAKGVEGKAPKAACAW